MFPFSLEMHLFHNSLDDEVSKSENYDLEQNVSDVNIINWQTYYIINI